MLSEIFLEFPSRIFHAPKKENKYDELEFGPLKIYPSPNPGIPGELRASPREIHLNDIARIPEAVGNELLRAIKDLSEKLGKHRWIYADFGWPANGRTEFYIAPDPWHVDEAYVEEVEDGPRFDPLTDVIMDGLRMRRFHIRYDGGHMTGAFLDSEAMENYKGLRRIIGKMRAKYGRMRHVLYQQRHALLEMGKIPTMGYSILVLNYNKPQMVIIPRVFVPKERWGIYEMLYNARIKRDLEDGKFWRTHESACNKALEELK